MQIFDDFGKFNPAAWLKLEPVSSKQNRATAAPKKFDFAAFFARALVGTSLLMAATAGGAATQSASSVQTALSCPTELASTMHFGASQVQPALPAIPSTGFVAPAVIGSAAVQTIEPSDLAAAKSTWGDVVQTGSPTDRVDLSPNTREVLSEHGVSRVEHFAALRQGWDFGAGEALSTSSIRAFDRFFGVGGLNPSNISVFMSSAGNLIANWEHGERIVEIEFGPEKLVYFNERTGEEYEVDARKLGEFRRVISRSAI